MKLVSGFDALVSEWVGRKITGESHVWGPHTAIGVVDKDDTLIGGVVFNNYRPEFGNIEVSFASDRADWLTPRLVRGILHYPFYQLGCQRITSVTPKRNRPARQFLQKFGFKHEGTIRRGLGDDDAIISGLLLKEWQEHRFHGRKSQSTRSA